jgi:hypothetical protein
MQLKREILFKKIVMLGSLGVEKAVCDHKAVIMQSTENAFIKTASS